MLTTASRDMSEPEGERRKKVGHYVLGPCLGEGSFAKVRQGTHVISREQVAVKIVSKRVIVQRDAARRNFRREALLLQHVQHPNIVRLYEAMETPNSYYLVFELAENGHLLQYVTDRETLPEGEARHFTRQIVSAVDHLHRSGIVHRDLKLENFLLNTSLDIKIVDFGLSALCQREGGLSTQCGSPVYAAPEIFGSRRYGPPVDMWSVGVCLYAMVVGRLPFLPDPPTNLAQLHALILRGATIPTFLSQGLQHILSGLLEVQESKRMSINDIWHHSWLTCNGSQPMVRYPPVSKAPPPSVDTAIVRYMTTMFRFSESDVIHSVTDRKLNASSATYHLLKRNMERQKLSSSEGSLGAGDDACAEDTSSRNSDRLTSARTSQSLGGSVRTVSDYSSSDTKECRTGGKNGEAQDVNNYKQCILYLKEARHGMFMNGRAFTKLRRDNVVGAVAASLDHNQYDEVRVGSHKLPFLNQHKGLHSFGQQLSQGQTSVSQLPTQTLTQFPHPHPHGGEVTRHLVQPASSQDVRLNVFGKSALKSQGQGQGGRQGDRSGSVAVNGNTTLYWSQPPPPPPPPNTAHGRRSSRHQIALSDPGPHSPRSYGTLTPPSLKDPFGRDTWRTVYQQEVRVAGENEARQQRTPGVAFVAPLSSPKALTSRQTESGGEKKQSYFLVRRLAADLNRKRAVPSDRRNQLTSPSEPDHPHHHITVNDDHLSDNNDAAPTTRPSTTEDRYADREGSFMTPVIRVTITSTFRQ